MARLGPLGCGLILALVLVSPASARIRVNVDWTFVQTVVSPTPNVLTSAAGTVFDLDGEDIRDNNGTKGAFDKLNPGIRTDGVPYSVKYGISRGRLTKEVHIQGVNFRVVVNTNGVDRCRASVTYFRSPGKRYFESGSQGAGLAIESAQRAENVRCAISN